MLYTIKLVPEDGATLVNRTNDEWELGYPFRVIESSSPLYRSGCLVSIQDINDQKTYYDSDFDITFETYTVVEKLKAEAEDDYVAQTIIDTMVDDDGELILRRGM